AVLRVLRRLYAPELPMTELEDMAAEVGSDVPFCVRGGTVLAEGRGERLYDLPPLPACWLALCKPSFGLSTPALFGRVRVPELKYRPDHNAMEQALAAGDLPSVARQLANVFEEVLTAEEGREIRTIEETLLTHGALGAVMTGSGPTVLGLFSQQTQAEAAAEALRRPDRQVFVARPV
ncbi:MAG: 4-(cytidine 5'-diphospho)-2-C-methyl-D-erythritol kinase, partial [Oscillospiraceae bacterium]|nr:4-(cytidine 5'-diphospho)-2-C-methyl-D-erythritol kinase [Oscillospiraceae bacterium]